MTSAMITPQNAPRDSAALAELPRAMRFRVALSCNMFPPDGPEEAAFIGKDKHAQAAELLAALGRWDKANGSNGAAPAQQPTQAAPPMQQPPVQQPSVGPPGMAPPPMNAGGPPPMQAGPPPMQQPSVGSPPMQAGGPPPMGAPPPMQPPAGPPPMQGGPPPMQQQQPMQPPPRQPVTHTDPTNHGDQAQPPLAGGGQAAGALLQAVKGVQEATAAMVGQVNTLSQTAGTNNQKIAEIHQVVIGMAKTQQSLAVLIFMVAENNMQLTKPQLAKMVAMDTEESLAQLLLTSGGQGKG